MDNEQAIEVAIERIDELIDFAQAIGFDDLVTSLYRNRNRVLDIQRKLERITDHHI